MLVSVGYLEGWLRGHSVFHIIQGSCNEDCYEHEEELKITGL